MADLIFRNKRLWRKASKPLILPPVHPNAGLRAEYRSKLERAVDELHRSIIYWLQAEWRKQPKLAQDAAPVTEMRALFKKLGKRWNSNFDKLAPELAEYFAQRATNRASNRLTQLLRDAGLTVEFVISREVKNAYQAVLSENVSLIKSIAQEHLAKVEQEVMRSVAAGRDLATLTEALHKQYNVTKRRAAFIARDQNNKATAVIIKARQQELGLTHARWLHSSGGNHPRPTHVAASGKVYEIAKGLYDSEEGRYVLPGELIGCRCVSQPVIPGFE